LNQEGLIGSYTYTIFSKIEYIKIYGYNS